MQLSICSRYKSQLKRSNVAGSGAALGVSFGGIAGKVKGALIGGSIGTAVGGTAGVLLVARWIECRKAAKIE